jgi:CheY-like chemotaxis protein
MTSIAAKPPLILMADDDPDDRLLAKDALNECGARHELQCIEDGEELMDYLLRRGPFSGLGTARRPALILLDLNMPRRDGREALREIKADPILRRIPVVIFTTSTADTDIVQSYELGANSFISKPVAFDALVQVMRRLTDYWLNTVILPPRN